MTVVSAARYRIVTLDTTSTDSQVTARIETAEALVSEWLRRPLEREERTEKVRVLPDGRSYPKATPIDSVSVPTGGLVEDTATLHAVTPDSFPWFDEPYQPYGHPRSTITYIGGWLGRDDPAADDTTRLPATVERYISMLACALAGPGESGYPAGATSVTLGDASITFAAPSDDLDVLVPGTTRALKPWRWQAPT